MFLFKGSLQIINAHETSRNLRQARSKTSKRFSSAWSSRKWKNDASLCNCWGKILFHKLYAATTADSLLQELDLPFIKIASTEIVSGVSGESEQKIRDLFSQALVRKTISPSFFHF